MSRLATKAADNDFYKARSNAADFNDKLRSREGAAEELGIDRTRLAKIELNSIIPYPEEVLMMSEVYNAPELTNHFCTEMCPLGCDIPKVDCASLDRITVKAMATFRKLEDTANLLLDIAGDGEISEEEKPTLEKILENLKEMEGINQSLKMWVKKNLNERR